MLHLITLCSGARRKVLCLTAHNTHKERATPLARFEPAIQASVRKKIIHDLKPTDNHTVMSLECFAPRTLPNLLLVISFRLLYLLLCTCNFCHSVHCGIKSRFFSTVQNCITSGPTPRPCLQQDTAMLFVCSRQTATIHA